MSENKRLNQPMELFGHSIKIPIVEIPALKKILNEDVKKPFKEYVCPHKAIYADLFDDGEMGKFCDKIRKQRPNPLIGNCSLKKYSVKEKINEKWIVCPHRFLENKTIFTDAKKFLNLDACEDIVITKEVKIGKQGIADFMLSSLNKKGEVLDFVSIEVQAIGTSNTGDIWDARNDHIKGNLKNNYTFGINKKMSSKTILVQMLHKSRELNLLQKKNVLVVQDNFWKHIKDTYEIVENFRPQNIEDPVHVHSYSLNENNGVLNIELVEKMSTDLNGLLNAIQPKHTQNLSFQDISNPIERRVKENKYDKL